ncbi:MAG: hypothetical protein H6912_06340 [Kordiimonadaceae bacterium]|nr:hypothetical protein [Kordiimonadaceae bacterium]
MYLKPTTFIAAIVIFMQSTIVNAQTVQTGVFTITSTSEKILGKENANEFKKILDIDEEITWSVYVPETYDPGIPPGILLFQFYTNKIEHPIGWDTAMEERNMILISIVGKGGEYPLKKELIISILAPVMLQQKYKINTSRVYTSSVGGCVNAGAVAMNYPNIIKGAIYVNCNPGTWRKKEPERVDLMRLNRYYFIAGRDRFKQIDNTQEIKKYEKAGINQVKFVRTGRLNRLDNLNREMLLDAIDYLDGQENINSDTDEN